MNLVARFHVEEALNNEDFLYRPDPEIHAKRPRTRIA